jgi:hypothetical protein
MPGLAMARRRPPRSPRRAARSCPTHCGGRSSGQADGVEYCGGAYGSGGRPYEEQCSLVTTYVKSYYKHNFEPNAASLDFSLRWFAAQTERLKLASNRPADLFIVPELTPEYPPGAPHLKPARSARERASTRVRNQQPPRAVLLI